MHLKRPGTSPLKKDLGYVEKNVVNQQNIFFHLTAHSSERRVKHMLK